MFGVRLLDFFTGVETWGEFWRLLSQLDEDSRFHTAQEEDEELAQRLIDRGLLPDEEELVWRPAARSWSLLHELVAQVRDRQGDIAALLADLPTGVKERHKPPAQFPRPDTALGRARAEVRARREQAYDDKIHDFVEKAKERWNQMSPEQRETVAVMT